MKRPFIILFVLFSAILFAGERGLTVRGTKRRERIG